MCASIMARAALGSVVNVFLHRGERGGALVQARRSLVGRGEEESPVCEHSCPHASPNEQEGCESRQETTFSRRATAWTARIGGTRSSHLSSPDAPITALIRSLLCSSESFRNTSPTSLSSPPSAPDGSRGHESDAPPPPSDPAPAGPASISKFKTAARARVGQGKRATNGRKGPDRYCGDGNNPPERHSSSKAATHHRIPLQKDYGMLLAPAAASSKPSLA